MKLLNPARIDSFPSEWTEDSPDRKDPRLTRRFEMSMADELRNRAATFRKVRQHALVWARKLATGGTLALNEHGPIFIPLEAFKVRSTIWSEVAAGVEPDDISPLNKERVPTGEEICVAACLNKRLADSIAELLLGWYKWFQADGNFPMYSDPDEYDKIVLMCALIVLESIANGNPHLAGLSDVEEAAKKWNPVYIC